eukprot:TRINITY_DN189_c2_g1_i2.p1 TRINITY_DN189_c2_g1~~TRINITY_DN189_c2_g1_i2.p1  ORF type:complete len:1407 (+),score=316.73 TRINITY_DN189_c2_g1_i2:45-4223(+)
MSKSPTPDGPQRCLVYCRLRPVDEKDSIGCDSISEMVSMDKGNVQLCNEKNDRYNFDGTFSSQSTQQEVFEGVAMPSVEQVLRGCTSAVMAYGQTGTGKTYTMSNIDEGSEGIIPRSAAYLFEKIGQNPNRNFSLTAQFVQVYRDNLTDLMTDSNTRVTIRLPADGAKGIELVNSRVIQISSMQDFIEMYKEGDTRKIVRKTGMNEFSSRGHTALVVTVRSSSSDPDDVSKPVEGKLTFIDLAGYERYGKTGIKGGSSLHADEAKTINKSLLSLGHVVTSLSKGDKFVPWRDSKLTMLLRDSLGGNSRCAVVITIGPASSNEHETLNSLDFGKRAMALIGGDPPVEEVDFEKLSAKLKILLAARDQTILDLQQSQGSFLPDEALSLQTEIEKRKAAHQRCVDVLKEERAARSDLENQVLSLETALQDRTITTDDAAEDKNRVEAMVAALQAQLQDSKETLGQSEGKIQSYEAQAAEEREAKQHLVAECTLLETRLQDTIHEKEEALAQANEKLEGKIESLKAQLELQSLDAAEDKNRVEAMVATLRAQLQESYEALGQSEGKIQSFDEEVSSLKAHIQDATSKGTLLETRLQDTADEKEALALMNEQLGSKVASLEIQLELNMEEATELFSDERRKDEVRRDKTIADLEERIAAAHLTIIELEERINHLTLSGAAMERKLAESSEKEASLLAEHERLRNQLHAFTKEDVGLKEEGSVKDATIAALRKECEDEKKKIGGKNFKYTSKIISQLVHIGQMETPRHAPLILRPQELLAELDTEEVKQAARYKLICVGGKATGKSSVQKCLAHEGGAGIFKRAPDVVQPTVAMSVENCTVAGKTTTGFLSKKTTTNTYFQVWDTPCDTRSLEALPEGCLPVSGCAYVLTHRADRAFPTEASLMSDVLYSVYGNCKKRLLETKQPIPLVVLGTRKDLVTGSSNEAYERKAADVRSWLEQHPLKQFFVIIETALVSCKEWSVKNSASGKTTSFQHLMSGIASNLRKRYPITPPCLLNNVSSVQAADTDTHEWWERNQKVHNNEERIDKTMQKGVLSLLVHIHRLKLRGIWLLGRQEFKTICGEHIPQYPSADDGNRVVDCIMKCLEDRSLILSLHDPEAEDEREGIVVLGISVVTSFIASVTLPAIYISQMNGHGYTLNHLKKSVQQQTDFNVEEIWRPDWEKLHAGRVTPSSVSCLVKHSAAFKKDPALGSGFLSCMNRVFKESNGVDFMPTLSVKELTPDHEAVITEAMRVHGGPQLLKSLVGSTDKVTPSESTAVLNKVVAGSSWSLLWRNGALFCTHNGSWGFMKITRVTVEVTSTSDEICGCEDSLSDCMLDAVWSTREFSSNGLPGLSPADSEVIYGSSSLEGYFRNAGREVLRGAVCPVNVLEKFSNRPSVA